MGGPSKGGAASAPSGAFDPKAELGVQAPVGFWDPAGFCDGIDEAGFKRYRSMELKHGRIAMMATIGFIHPIVLGHFPGYLSPSAGLKFADIPDGVAAISKVPNGGLIQIFLFAALIEFGLSPNGIEEWKYGPAGDYDKGFLGMFGPVTDPAKKERSLNAELANGRLAMVAITGMVLQNGITGSTGDAMWFPASASRVALAAVTTEDSEGRSRFVVPGPPQGMGGPSKGGAASAPSGAFDPKAELGVQAPVGFWDPAGFCDGIDEAGFKRYRSMELKHGRIAMMA